MMLNKKRLLILFSVFIVLFLFCTDSSPLIRYRGVDSSVYFTVGRGIIGGKTAYTDLFDNKGLYLYFFNAAAALISGSTTIGIFIVEWIFHFTSFIFLFLIGMTVLDSSRKSLLFSLAVMVFYFFGGTYEGGNLTETYCLTFQIISFYLLVRFFSSNESQHSPSFMFVHGICASAAFFLRPNLVLMWVPLAAGIFILMLTRKEYAAAVKNLLFGILGLAAAALPVLIYSLITGCFSEMIDQTILFSFRYIENDGGLISNILTDMFRLSTIGIYILVIASLIIICAVKKAVVSAKLIYAAMTLFSLAAVSLSGRSFGHYREYLIPLIIPAMIFLTHLITRRISSALAFSALYALTSTIILFNCGKFTDFFITGSEDKKRVEAWAKLIDDYSEHFDPEDKMLVMGNRAVYYNVLEKLPEEKYFYIPDINNNAFSEPLDAQMNALKSGKYDVVFVPLIFSSDISFKEDINKELHEILHSDYDKWITNYEMQVVIYEKKRGV
ncbi:MAG: hypothetical protein IJ555_06295 [Ruminococcus sp.]|nr:hypothetical protein [Ruminococcus sp.]